LFSACLCDYDAGGKECLPEQLPGEEGSRAAADESKGAVKANTE